MLIIYAILTCFMIAVIASDISRYLIPNWLVLALIVFYPVVAYVAVPHPDWKIACAVALATFVVGYVLFSFRLMGGGDIKLLTATALYAGSGAMLDFIIYVALLGGVGTLLLLPLRTLAPYVCLKLNKDAACVPRVLTHGQPVPYGVAIATAFLLLLWSGKLSGLVL